MSRNNDALALLTRAKTGTTGSNASRREGKIPGILYGHGSSALAVEVDAHAFDQLLHEGGRNHLLEITIDGKNKDTALVREVQRDPISRRVLHADFQRVSATEEISASLPLVTVGTADGVRNFGGVMDVIVREIDVLAPANALPESIEADISHLGLHGHLTAADLKLPKGVKLDMEASTILVTIEPSRVEIEAAPALEAPAPGEVPTVAETEPEAEAG
jgi:large subunit ribosomal protein L25